MCRCSLFSRIDWQLAQIPEEIQQDFHLPRYHQSLLIFTLDSGDGGFA